MIKFVTSLSVEMKLPILRDYVRFFKYSMSHFNKEPTFQYLRVYKSNTLQMQLVIFIGLKSSTVEYVASLIGKIMLFFQSRGTEQLQKETENKT